MNRVYAVVVTYNRKRLLKECIEAILTQSVRVEKLIIIDNNSTDGTEGFLNEEQYVPSSGIQYKRLKKNIGGAGGFYEGMKMAQMESPDWIWIMDDDTIPTRNCLEELLKAKEHIQNKVSFLASSVRGVNGQAMNVPKIARNQFNRYTDWYQYLDEGIVEIVKATFVSLLVNGDAVRQCGLPWKEFFLWGDDSEYTQRMIRDYGKAYMVGKSLAVHKRLSAEELNLVKEENIERIPMYFYYYRNNLIVFWEYEKWVYKMLCMGKLGYDFFLTVVKGKHKVKKLRTITKAFFAFLFGTYDRKSFKNRANE